MRDIFYAVKLYALPIFICLMVNIAIEGCKVMVFKVELQGQALKNHVFKSDYAMDDSHCRAQCFLDDRCISYNFGASVHGEKYMCELSESDHVMHPGDLVDRTSTSYTSAQNSCNCSKVTICRFNFEDGTHRCDCYPGFTGIHCDININECTSHPCQHGGSCQDQVNSYVCTCAVGFEGANCEINIDDCTANPCQNRGTCLDLINDYNCSCVHPYAGRNCTAREGWVDSKSGIVCIGSKGNKKATFECPLQGDVIAVKLIYESGGLSYNGILDKGNWGGTTKGPYSLQIHITRDKGGKDRIAPPLSIPLDTDKGIMGYSLPGVTNMDPELVFPDFEPSMYVTSGQKLRVWFGQDLSDIEEDDNEGETCVQVKVLYSKT